LQVDIPVDSFVMSKFGLGLEYASLLDWRSFKLAIEDAFVQHTNWDIRKGKPYVIVLWNIRKVIRKR
jgi:uridine phosphorylase